MTYDEICVEVNNLSDADKIRLHNALRPIEDDTPPNLDNLSDKDKFRLWAEMKGFISKE